MSEVKAIVFDCDGVLVNSEEIIQDIELALLAEHGLDYERAEFSRRFLGVADDTFSRELNADSMRELGKPLPDDFFTRLSERARSALDSDLVAFDGVQRVAAAWNGALAVASSSSAQYLVRKLEMTGLDHLFDPHIYSAEHVGAGKPDPAIYLHVASKLEIDPEHCLAVEDSVNGVVSARAAGMRTIGFTGGKHCLSGHAELLRGEGAELVVESMHELAVWLEDL